MRRQRERVDRCKSRCSARATIEATSESPMPPPAQYSKRSLSAIGGIERADQLARVERVEELRAAQAPQPTRRAAAREARIERQQSDRAKGNARAGG